MTKSNKCLPINAEFNEDVTVFIDHQYIVVNYYNKKTQHYPGLIQVYRTGTRELIHTIESRIRHSNDRKITIHGGKLIIGSYPICIYNLYTGNIEKSYYVSNANINSEIFAIDNYIYTSNVGNSIEKVLISGSSVEVIKKNAGLIGFFGYYSQEVEALGLSGEDTNNYNGYIYRFFDKDSEFIDNNTSFGVYSPKYEFNITSFRGTAGRSSVRIFAINKNNLFTISKINYSYYDFYIEKRTLDENNPAILDTIEIHDNYLGNIRLLVNELFLVVVSVKDIYVYDINTFEHLGEINFANNINYYDFNGVVLQSGKQSKLIVATIINDKIPIYDLKYGLASNGIYIPDDEIDEEICSEIPKPPDYTSCQDEKEVVDNFNKSRHKDKYINVHDKLQSIENKFITQGFINSVNNILDKKI